MALQLAVFLIMLLSSLLLTESLSPQLLFAGTLTASTNKDQKSRKGNKATGIQSHNHKWRVQNQSG